MSIKTNPEKGEYLTEVGCIRVDESSTKTNNVVNSNIVSLEQQLESLKEDVYGILKNEKYLKNTKENRL